MTQLKNVIKLVYVLKNNEIEILKAIIHYVVSGFIIIYKSLSFYNFNDKVYLENTYPY